MKPLWLRGILEISNYCKNNCHYCGIRAANTAVHRYRLNVDEVVAAAEPIRRAGCGTVVLQAGDDPAFTDEVICEIVRRLKLEYDFPAVTLSLGVKSREQLQAYRQAGADRYLLRFETCDPDRFASIHPDESLQDRINCLYNIREVGMWMGTGFMIGLPGQTEKDLERELDFVQELAPDMVGCGPFIPHPQTPLANQKAEFVDREVYYRVIHQLRQRLPRARIPATTAFDALEKDGRIRVLLSGDVDVYMPNFTPLACRGNYLLYPGKPGVDDDPESLATRLMPTLQRLGFDPVDEWGMRLPIDGALVNGSPYQLPLPCTIKVALQFLGIHGQVATELNGAIVQEKDRSQTIIKEGDSLELITFVGGG